MQKWREDLLHCSWREWLRNYLALHKSDNLLYSGQNASKYAPLLKRNKYPSSILVVSCIRANFHFFFKVRILTYLYNLWLTVRGVCRPFLIVFLKWDVKLKLCSTVLRVWMLFERGCELLLRMFYKLNVRTNQIEKLDNENILYFWVGCFWVCSVLHVHVTDSAN